MSIDNHFDKTAVIKEYDGTVDAWGKPDYSSANWDQIDAPNGTKGMLRPLKTREEFVKGKETVYRDAIFYMEYNEDLNEAMRMTIDEIEYHITHIKDPNSRGHHMEVSLFKII